MVHFFKTWTIKTLIVLTVLLHFPAVTPELLHGPIHSPYTSQIQFSPISRGTVTVVTAAVTAAVRGVQLIL